VDPQQLIQDYLAGPALLRQAVAGMSAEQLDATPIAGKWSSRQVVAHICDFEPIYADRIKRIIAEEQPTFFGGDPDLFAARLGYANREIDQELQLIEAVRGQLARILQSMPPEVFQRTGIHSEDGPRTIEQLLRTITGHIPHHAQFIEQKRQALRENSKP
jgi:uncharacterized damage-inducible protein DinB